MGRFDLLEEAMAKPIKPGKGSVLSKGSSLAVTSRIESFIITVRRHRVMLDSDLAAIYAVTTKALNQAVRRNAERFPPDFVFQLTLQEVANLRSQFVTSNGLAAHSDAGMEHKPEEHRAQVVTGSRGGRRYQPYAFTEHGALMAANVLRSPRAVEMSVFVVRAFVRLRQWMADHAELARRLEDLERKHDAQFKVVFDAIRQLMAHPEPKKKEIGFHVRERRAAYSRGRDRK
jgi:hypothetical protein